MEVSLLRDRLTKRACYGLSQLENALDKKGSGDKDVIKVIVDISANA